MAHSDFRWSQSTHTHTHTAAKEHKALPNETPPASSQEDLITLCASIKNGPPICPVAPDSHLLPSVGSYSGCAGTTV